MKIYEILKNDLLQIPASREGIKNDIDRALPNFVSSYLNQYINLLKTIDNFPVKNNYEFQGKPNNEFLVEFVEKISVGLRKTIIKYLEGYYNKSYDIFSEIMTYDSLNIFRTLFYLNKYDFGDERYYRVFINSEQKEILNTDLFHVPYELIERVNNQRYSISGFPCLYLGRNIYTCIKELELDKSDCDLRNIYVSQFKVNTNRNIRHIELLDFTIKTYSFKTEYLINGSGDYEALFLYLLMFPLIFSTSLRVSLPDRPFKPEYIIPQLILQWVRSEGLVDGIKYSSSKLTSFDVEHYDDYYNIVLPPREVTPSGQCSYLKGQMLQTEPLNFYNCLKDSYDKLTKIDLKMCEKIQEKINERNILTI
jgi:hypothetical protein